MFRTMTTTALLVMGIGFFPSNGKADAPSEGAGGAAVLGFTPLSDEEGLRRLPISKVPDQPLPSWAKVLAGPMPRTTAAMLNLDFVHRAHSPLAPKLRAEMRWVAAHANHCAYSEAYALADARRAGLAQGEIDALRQGDYSQFPASEKAALEFARKMTVDSFTVTDDEFAYLVKEYSEKDVVSMVLLMAYSNFQDRLLLCLGSPLEPNGPLPPIEVVLPTESAASQANARPTTLPSPLPKPTGKDLIEDDLEWTGLTYDDLQERMERQRNKKTRVRVPTWEEVKPLLPANNPNAQRQIRIVWTLVCIGHQPEMGNGWSACTRALGLDLGKYRDRIFEEGLFWVTTRALNCPYCMGHCEMIWETSGLTKPEIAERSRLLAGDDWSSFSTEEQRAYAFSRKLTRAPWTITGADIGGLKRDFGPERALAVIWWTCRGHYMTRVSNGFQLGLERDNVFRGYFTDTPSPAQPGQQGSGR